MATCMPNRRLPWCHVRELGVKKPCRDTRSITDKMEFSAKITFVFGVAFAIILRTRNFATPLRSGMTAHWDRHTANNIDGRCCSAYQRVIQEYVRSSRVTNAIDDSLVCGAGSRRLPAQKLSCTGDSNCVFLCEKTGSHHPKLLRGRPLGSRNKSLQDQTRSSELTRIDAQLT
jgi:hypothetical protein